jgi:hypothetical protein
MVEVFSLESAVSRWLKGMFLLVREGARLGGIVLKLFGNLITMLFAWDSAAGVFCYIVST